MSAEEFISFRGPLGLKCGSHINSELEILVVSDGIIEVLLAGERIIAQKDEAVVILPYEVHEFNPTNGARGRVYMFSQTIVDELFKSRDAKEISSGKFKVSSTMRSFIDRFDRRAESSPDALSAKSLFLPLISEYLNGYTITVRNNRNSITLRNVVDYMQKNLSESITLKSVAANFGLNSAALAAMLKDYTGISFNNFLNNLRVERAVQYFYNSDMSITEVAYLSGFGSIRNFNRIFYNTLGVTPSEYIKGISK